MFNLSAVQAALAEFRFDGWLLCDFRSSNVLARRILDLADKPLMTRRFFYFVPARGEPQKLVHRIESGALDHLPGAKNVYLRWQELEAGLQAMVRGTPVAEKAAGSVADERAAVRPGGATPPPPPCEGGESRARSQGSNAL